MCVYVRARTCVCVCVCVCARVLVWCRSVEYLCRITCTYAERLEGGRRECRAAGARASAVCMRVRDGNVRTCVASVCARARARARVCVCVCVCAECRRNVMLRVIQRIIMTRTSFQRSAYSISTPASVKPVNTVAKSIVSLWWSTSAIQRWPVPRDGASGYSRTGYD